MAAAEKISALRGMRDVFGREVARRRTIQDALAEHLRRHSYTPIETPIAEHTELYLRKSGEDIAARLYDFDFKNRRLALRPEVTASVLRAYIDHLRDEPLPLRLQYGGPVFRYEKPQQHRYRQFTLAGAELLGAAGPRADAELLHLACSGLERLGIRDYRLVIGITDVLEGFLAKLGLRRQLHNFMLRNMENLRKRGRPSIVDALRALYPEFEDQPEGAAAEHTSSQQLVALLREMSDDEAQLAISDFLRSLNIRIATNRDESDVIDRLLRKIREDQQSPKLRRALDFMARLGRLNGAPGPALAGARALAAEFALDPAPLNALERTLAALADCGELRGAVELDFGLSRGLHYYTGMMFEIYCPAAMGEEIQVCGGGRYDHLVSILGGGSTPAAGFAWGIERLASALPSDASAASNAPDVVIMPLGEAEYATGYAIALALRQRGLVVEVSIDRRSLRRSLRAADRRGAPAAIIIGESERQQQSAILRDMRRHQERELAFSALPGAVEELCRATG